MLILHIVLIFCLFFPFLFSSLILSFSFPFLPSPPSLFLSSLPLLPFPFHFPFLHYPPSFFSLLSFLPLFSPLPPLLLPSRLFTPALSTISLVSHFYLTLAYLIIFKIFPTSCELNNIEQINHKSINERILRIDQIHLPSFDRPWFLRLPSPPWATEFDLYFKNLANFDFDYDNKTSLV